MADRNGQERFSTPACCVEVGEGLASCLLRPGCVQAADVQQHVGCIHCVVQHVAIHVSPHGCSPPCNANMLVLHPEGCPRHQKEWSKEWSGASCAVHGKRKCARETWSELNRPLIIMIRCTNTADIVR